MKAVRRTWIACVALVLAAAMSPQLARADATIEYEARDEGGGVWRYDYRLGGEALSANQGFKVAFDEELCLDLRIPDDALTPGWDVMLFQPDLALTDAGYYDALWLEGAYDGPFSVVFTWLGEGAPGAQAFNLYQLGDDGFTVVEEWGYGETALRGGPAPVPEPASGLLVLCGLAAVAGALRLRGRKSGKEPPCGSR